MGTQHIDYDTLAQDALRGIVRTVLMHVARSGLPGQHHFYIAFNTNAPGAVISPRLKEKYPEEMTIVLQHRFWDLLVNEERFEVKLTFDGIPERLVVPFAAIRVFFDPSVPYGLQFEGSDVGGDMAQNLAAQDTDAFEIGSGIGAARARKSPAPERSAAPVRAEKKPRNPRKPRVTKAEAGGEPSKSRGQPQAAGDQGSGKAQRPRLVPPKADQHQAAANDTKIVQLDQFRKK